MIRLMLFLKPYSKYLFAFWLIAIFTVSSLPSLPTVKIKTDESFIRLDYLIHFIEYMILVILALMTYSDVRFRIPANKMILVMAVLILFAVVDEYHQKFIPGRSFNPVDTLSNLTGIASGLIFWIVTFRFLIKKLLKDMEKE